MTKKQFSPEDLERIDEVLRFRSQLDRLCGRGNPVGIAKNAGERALAEAMANCGLDGEEEDLVRVFRQVVSQAYWCDHNYHPQQVGELLKTREAIALATLSQIKSMLTYCVRGERFREGHFLAAIREGRIKAILERLLEIRRSAN